MNLAIQTAEFPNWKDQAEKVQRDLKQAGIQLNIKTLDAQTYYDTLWTKKDYDLIFYRTYSDALMPYNFMNSVFKNAGGKPGVLANDSTLTKQLDNFQLKHLKLRNNVPLMIYSNTLINNIMVCPLPIQTRHLW